MEKRFEKILRQSGGQNQPPIFLCTDSEINKLGNKGSLKCVNNLQMYHNMDQRYLRLLFRKQESQTKKINIGKIIGLSQIIISTVCHKAKKLQDSSR